MNKNRVFLIGAIVIAILGFAGASFLNKKTTTETVASTPALEASLLIKPHSPIKGKPDAKVTIVEFLDPECEACRSMHPIVKRILAEHENDVRVVIRYMPLHGNSKLAATAIEEAREQGKFAEALDTLFDRQPQWADHGQPRPELIADFLAELGVNKESLLQEKLFEKHGWKVDMDQADGVTAGVTRTPTFFVNGRVLSEIGYGPVKAAVEKALQEQ